MLLNGRAQRPRADAVDDIDGLLVAQHRIVDELVHLAQRLLHGIPQQVDLHAGFAVVVQLDAGLGARRLFGTFLHLVRRAQTFEGHLGFHDAGAYLHHAVPVRAGGDGGGLVQFSDDNLLPHAHLL